MKRLSLIIAGIGIVSLSWTHVWAQGAAVPESSPLKLNVYLERYKTEDGVTTKVAMQRALMRLNRECPGEKKLTEDDVRRAIEGRTDHLLDKCLDGKRVQSEELQRLRSRILSILSDEEEAAEFEEQLGAEVREQTLFGDARTDNTAYDLMVDLNILDVIWFGDKAQYVRAPWGGFGNPFKKGEYDPDDPDSLSRDGNASGNSNTNGSGTNGNTNENRNLNVNGGQGNTNGSNGNSNGVGGGSTNGNVNGGPICLPLDAPALGSGVLADLTRDADGIRTTGSGSSLYVEDSDPRPLEERPYGTVIETAPINVDAEYAPGDFSNNLDDIESGAETSAVGEGNDRLLCNAFFCIKVSLKKGVATVAVKDNSIRAHYAAILKDLTKLRGYNLELGQTTSGFLDPGMFNIDFAKNLHLEVFINRKPVWNPNKYGFASEEVKRIRKDLREERKILLADVQSLCYDTNIQQPVDQDTQTVEEKAQACVRKIQTNWNDLIQTQRQEARKRNEVDMAPLEDEVRQMREFIRTMVSNFRSSDGIRSQALQLSKKPTK